MIAQPGELLQFDRLPGTEFDAMVVGEIVEEQNQSMDWFYSLPAGKKQELYCKQLAKPPRKPRAGARPQEQANRE